MFASELHKTRPDLDDRYLVPVANGDPGDVAAWAKDQPGDPEDEHWSVRMRKKFEAMGEKPPEGLLEEAKRQEDFFDGKHYDKSPEIHQNHEPETRAELETAAIMAAENKPTVEECLSQLWAETGVEHCRCCFKPRQDCLTRSWMQK